ncbi:hypothetical protein [Arenibaculum pallidiluteum]|uniref:hypothetical protein n=1 Tax=Arenibaculum pallidiluteum TaxID=2812559 RepID=UPI001A96C9BA|nr:hypothetical protein [Arenibaculum pallidiluteum]
MTDTSAHHFEVQTFHGAYWLVARREDDMASAMAAADQAGLDGVGEAVQVVRCEAFPSYGHEVRTVLRRWSSGTAAIDAGTPLVLPGTEEVCQDLADLREDRGRNSVAQALARWLAESALTPVELLHSEAHARRLAEAGVVLQGAAQKVAVAQVRESGTPVQKRFKDLLALCDSALAEMTAEARAEPSVPLDEVGWGAFCAGLSARLPASQLSPARLRAAQLRALAGWLASCKGWLERAERIGALVSADLPPRDLAPLDMVAAEIVAGRGAPAELAGRGSDRETQIRTLVALNAGETDRGRERPTLATLATLIGMGLAPRTRSAIRRRVAIEIGGGGPLRAGASLAMEVEALAEIRTALQGSPPLGEDAELAELLERRALRAITPEAVHGWLDGCRSASERFRSLIRLADRIPFAAAKAKLLEFAQGTCSVEDLIREGAGSVRDITGSVRDVTGSVRERAAAVPLLAELHREVTAATIDPGSKARLQDELDAALLELLRTDVMGAANRSYSERVVTLIRLCGACPLPEGRARSMAVETIGRALAGQEFVSSFLKRFRTEAERKQALGMLRNLLLASGLARGGSEASQPLAGTGR